MNEENLLENAAQDVAQKPDGLPDKFWDAENNVVRIDAMVKSYAELEKKLSGGNALSLFNIPENASDYQVAVKDELFEPDMELNERLHAKGFTAEQVQEVYDLAVDKMIPMIMEMASEFQADREIERLIKYFGGEDQWREASRQMLQYGQRHFPPQVLEGMSSSYEGIMALYKMMQSEEPMAINGHGKSMSLNAEKDLQSMMNNPKYWRDKDPAFIAKVTDGFKNLYAE